MGLFSSKKKVTVTTTVQRIVEDHQVPQTTKSSVLRAGMTDEPLATEIVSGIIESVGIKANRMHDWAQTNYVHGCPHGELVSSVSLTSVVKGVLEDPLEVPVTLEYHRYRPLNLVHAGFQQLQDAWGYDPDSNEITTLSAQKGSPVYLHDLVPVYAPDTRANLSDDDLQPPGFPGNAGYTPERPLLTDPLLRGRVQASPWQEDPQATTSKVLVSYVWQANGSLQQGTLELTHAQFDEGGDFHQVRYHWLDAQGQRRSRYWTYDDESGEYPEIDNYFLLDPTEVGSYFPIAYFRESWTSLTSGPNLNSERYHQTRRLVRYLGINYKELGDSLHENPDIGSIMSAMLIMAVPLVSNDPVEIRYLYEYFHAAYLSLVESTDFDDGATGRNAILIKDNNMRMSLSFQELEKRRVAGNIGKKGTFTQHVDGNVLVLRRQVKASFYDELRLDSPITTWAVVGNYATGAGLGSENLLIPLNRAIVETIPVRQREALYLRSMHLVFHTYQVSKTKWYQSGWFKIFLIVVAIAIAVFTGGIGAGMIAAAKAGLSTLAWFVAATVVKGLVVSFAFKMFAQAVGPEAAMLVAVVAAAYGAYQMLSGNTAQYALLNAENMLKMSTGLADAASKELVTRLTSAYDNALGEFRLLTDQMQEEMKSWEKLIALDHGMDPFMFVGMQPFTRFGESPNDLYNRTVHAGNIGVLSVDAVSLFVEQSLRLPTLDTTVGDTMYG